MLQHNLMPHFSRIQTNTKVQGSSSRVAEWVAHTQLYDSVQENMPELFKIFGKLIVIGQVLSVLFEFLFFIRSNSSCAANGANCFTLQQKETSQVNSHFDQFYIGPWKDKQIDFQVGGKNGFKIQVDRLTGESRIYAVLFSQENKTFSDGKVGSLITGEVLVCLNPDEAVNQNSSQAWRGVSDNGELYQCATGEEAVQGNFIVNEDNILKEFAIIDVDGAILFYISKACMHFFLPICSFTDSLYRS